MELYKSGILDLRMSTTRLLPVHIGRLLFEGMNQIFLFRLLQLDPIGLSMLLQQYICNLKLKIKIISLTINLCTSTIRKMNFTSEKYISNLKYVDQNIEIYSDDTFEPTTYTELHLLDSLHSQRQKMEPVYFDKNGNVGRIIRLKVVQEEWITPVGWFEYG